MTANIFSVNELIVTLAFLALLVGVPTLVIVLAVRASRRRPPRVYTPWLDKKDEDQ
jgi:hypothetical protein